MSEEQDAKATEQRPLKDRLAGYAKQHPGTTLIVAATATAVLAGEFAIGAVLGVGAALLVTKRSGAELRRELRERLAAGKDWARRLRERANADDGGAAPAP